MFSSSCCSKTCRPHLAERCTSSGSLLSSRFHLVDFSASVLHAHNHCYDTLLEALPHCNCFRSPLLYIPKNARTACLRSNLLQMSCRALQAALWCYLFDWHSWCRVVKRLATPSALTAALPPGTVKYGAKVTGVKFTGQGEQGRALQHALKGPLAACKT